MILILFFLRRKNQLNSLKKGELITEEKSKMMDATALSTIRNVDWKSFTKQPKIKTNIPQNNEL